MDGVYFESGGHRLLGTLYLAGGDEPKPTALLLHGCPGIEKNYDVAGALRDQGWNSLLFHYRGCWGSGGSYALRTLPADVTAALDYLEAGKHLQVDCHRIVLIGHSLGGWAAILAGASDPRVRAVAVYGGVVELSSREYTTDYVAAEFTPWLHGITAEEFVAQVNALDERHSPLERVAGISPRPLVVIHGGADAVVPTEQARVLFDRGRDPREFILVPEANHGFSWHRRELIGHLLDWLGRLRLK
jgi:dipeptidyl aminopeptidase/acylaminoacyl peptidase